MQLRTLTEIVLETKDEGIDLNAAGEAICNHLEIAADSNGQLDMFNDTGHGDFRLILKFSNHTFFQPDIACMNAHDELIREGIGDCVRIRLIEWEVDQDTGSRSINIIYECGEL